MRIVLASYLVRGASTTSTHTTGAPGRRPRSIPCVYVPLDTRAQSLTLEYYDTTGLGTFTRP